MRYLILVLIYIGNSRYCIKMDRKYHRILRSGGEICFASNFRTNVDFKNNQTDEKGRQCCKSPFNGTVIMEMHELLEQNMVFYRIFVQNAVSFNLLNALKLTKYYMFGCFCQFFIKGHL